FLEHKECLAANPRIYGQLVAVLGKYSKFASAGEKAAVRQAPEAVESLSLTAPADAADAADAAVATVATEAAPSADSAPAATASGKSEDAPF
ncbi:MAG: inositol monophosphatase, partial [Rhodoferax sp.]|nr:inositol monophosphatase [Rhodoferax sp.]